MLKISLLVLATFLTCLTLRAATNEAPHSAKWENAILKFEARDKTNPPPKDAIVLIGSSSVVKWTNAPAQFPKHRIINRGFGGSYLEDSVAFVDRIVAPYHPKLVVLYAGDNDLAGGRSAERVFNDFKQFVANVRAGLPKTPIAFISIKPSPSREKFLPKCKEANRLISEYIATDKSLIYIDVFTPMLDAEGKARGELFIKDRLHMNEEGYKLWAGIVTPIFDKFDSPTAK